MGELLIKRSVLRAKNVRGMRGDILVNGRMSAALPRQPLEKAELHASCAGMSIYSEVRKGRRRDSCQDSAIVISFKGTPDSGSLKSYFGLRSKPNLC